MMIWLCQRSFLRVSLFLLCNVARLGVLVVVSDLLCDLCKVVEKLKKSTDSVFSVFFWQVEVVGGPVQDSPKLYETLRNSTEVPLQRSKSLRKSTEVYETFPAVFAHFDFRKIPRRSKLYETLRKSTEVYESLRKSTNFLALQALFFMFLFVFVPEGAAWEHFAACVPFLTPQCRTQQFFRILSIPCQIWQKCCDLVDQYRIQLIWSSSFILEHMSIDVSCFPWDMTGSS